MTDFEKALRIDLIVGTHYDADHLEGLVPIIDDSNIEIGEAWLPPVANDSELHALEDAPQEQNFLAHQFASEDTNSALRKYLQSKANLCRRIERVERMADEYRARPKGESSLATIDLHADDDPGLEFFDAHKLDAERALGIDGKGHADDPVLEGMVLPSSFGRYASFYPWTGTDGLEALGQSWKYRPDRALPESISLAFIRRSTATQAITAISLHKVVLALRKRNIPIRCETIQDGLPRRFIWIRTERRFVPAGQIEGHGPELLLLGPSKGLVKKHWDRLPIGAYANLISYVQLPVRSITPSNQLSYVMRFAFAGQNILVTGDSGFVDFQIGRTRRYHQALIDSLQPLHVVQIAHHAGANAHFYRCLLGSGYRAQDAHSFLLLSHAVDDPHRPSDVFKQFVAQLRSTPEKVTALFTSKPRLTHVQDYRPIISTVKGSAPADCGDVRLTYDTGGWSVIKHSISV
jgi:hypothetical protein